MMTEISSPVQRLLDHLDGVKPGANGFTALCPAHDDTKNSLSVDEGDRGAVVHCFAGCTTEAVCQAVGLKLQDLFYDSKVPISVSLKKSRVYIYRDETGATVYKIKRTTGKEFYPYIYNHEAGKW